MYGDGPEHTGGQRECERCKEDKKARLKTESFRLAHGIRETINLRKADLRAFLPRVLPCTQAKPSCPKDNFRPALTSGLQRGAARLAGMLDSQKNYLGGFGPSVMVGWKYECLFPIMEKAHLSDFSWVALFGLVQIMESVEREESSKEAKRLSDKPKGKADK